MHSCEVTATLRDFSNSDNSSEWEVSKFDLKYFLITHGCMEAKFLFYADGNCEENKGYISVKCSGMIPNLQILSDRAEEIEIRFFFSVVDISKNKMFTQSIVFIPGKTTPRDLKKDSRENFELGFERYLKREILLNDPAELLPGDCLTLSVKIESKNLPSIHDSVDHTGINENRNEINIYSTKPRCYCIDKFSFLVDECYRLYIPLDTFYGRELCSLSGFFQLAADTPLTESTTRGVHIPDEELFAFTNIFRIFFETTTVLVLHSITEIFQMYVIADKYDFQSLFQICRQLIKAFLRTTDDSRVREHAAESVPNITKLAEEYKDSDLKDIINTYLESKEKFGTNDYALGKYLKEKIFSDWKCVSKSVKRWSNPRNNICEFILSRFTNPEFEFHQ